MTEPTLGPDIRYVLSQLNTNSHFDGFDDVGLFRLMAPDVAMRAAGLIANTAAQLRQDILAAVVSDFKQGGYFLEIGATDGAYLSNTLLLEKDFDWTGILAEPARYWHEALRKTRKSVIDTRCVHAETGKTLMFSEVAADQALSTITEYSESDFHASTRSDSAEYPVETVSLTDLLDANDAPEAIDFLSIDTEGSEFDILNAFDFGRYRFGAICCEHNFAPQRDAILALLKGHGYIRILNGISQFDDWYVHDSMVARLDAALPDWRNVSNQDSGLGDPPLSEKDRMIRTLQATVSDLMVERDAYKEVLEVEKAQEIALLKETVENLIVDRDAHKGALEEMKNRTLLQRIRSPR